MIKSAVALSVLAVVLALPAHAQGDAYPLGLNWSSSWWNCYNRAALNQNIVIQVGDDNRARVVDLNRTDRRPRAVPLGLNRGSAGCELQGQVFLCTYR